MSDYVKNPPDASSLMTSARSFGNYDLALALADLIDNSITAKSSRIDITCSFNDGKPVIRIRDNGTGMSKEELIKAMRPAFNHPEKERSKDDLGRFGWGMKSASFSQCEKMTVVTSKEGEKSSASWDLNNIDDWRMGVLQRNEMQEKSPEIEKVKNGTEIIWENCDRLTEDYEIDQDQFNNLILKAREKLRLIFHKYLSGKARGKKFSLFFGDLKIEPYDPFHSEHKATQKPPNEIVELDRIKIPVQVYILPHYSKITHQEHELLAGEDGTVKNQGFYLYRNSRLIVYGTWFGLQKFNDISQHVRIDVDIPNSLDKIWKITVDKSDAQLPFPLREKLKNIIKNASNRSVNVERSKGGQLKEKTQNYWMKYSRNGQVNFSVNRDHPLINKFFDYVKKNDKNKEIIAEEVLKGIEQNVPYIFFSNDHAKSKSEVSQTPSERQEFIDSAEVIFDFLLEGFSGNQKKHLENLKKVEPFSLNWKLVQELIDERYSEDE